MSECKVREARCQGPVVNFELKPLVKVERMLEEGYGSVADSVSSIRLGPPGVSGIPHRKSGKWSMISIMSIVDSPGCFETAGEELATRCKDGRLAVMEKNYIAYCFQDKKLYCVKPVSAGDMNVEYVLPVEDLNNYDLKTEDFKALNQYRTVLFNIAVDFNDKYRDMFDQIFRSTLPFLDPEIGNQKFLEDRWREATVFHDYSLISSFKYPENFFKGYSFDGELGLMLKPEGLGDPIVTADDTPNTDTKGMVNLPCDISQEFYLRSEDTEIGSRIKKIREGAKLSQSIVAGSLGKTQAQISKIETGELEPGIKFMLGFSEITNTSMGHITGEPMADRVGKLIWMCTGSTHKAGSGEPEEVTLLYDRYRMLGYDSVSRVIFVTPSKPLVRAESVLSPNKKVDTELRVEDAANPWSISAYPLRNAVIGRVAENSLCQNDGGYSDMFFVPNTFVGKLLSGIGTGYSVKGNVPDLPQGYEAFDEKGKLILGEFVIQKHSR